METHDEPRNCIDEQTNIRSLSIELCCKKMAANYKMTEKQLEVLLNDSKARVLSTLGGVILINTTDEKQLAKAIVEEVKHYFGEPKNKPKNTADETLILSRADEWLQGIKSGTRQTPRQYADFVVERTRHDYSTGTRIETTSFEEIIKAVEAWADKKREQPAPAQQLPDELKTDEAQRYFSKAVELGLMDNGYKWLKGLQMLSCFTWEMSRRLSLGKGNRTAWKPFEILFGVDKGKLRLNYNDIQKTGQNPSESSLIDKVFE